MCSSEIKISLYFPHGGHFCFRPPTPCNFYPRGVLSYPPPSNPWNFHDFPTWLEKNIWIFPSKMLLDYTSLRQIICFCEKLKTGTLNYLLGAGWNFSRAYQRFHVFPLQASITLSLGFLVFSYLLWSPRFGCMAVIRKPSCLRLRAVSLSFSVRRPKRARHTNYHEPDWRRET